jgi:uncharacterized membrane protein YedE/YeeE
VTVRPVALLFGVAFGVLLAWARLDDPAVIERMLLLRDPYVFLLMCSSIAVGFVGVRALRGARARSLIGGEPIAWTITRPARRHVIGSVVFGIGWSVAATCPGPLAVQLGSGRIAALFTVAGLLGGVALRGRPGA